MHPWAARLRRAWHSKAPLEVALTIFAYGAYALATLCVVGVVFLFTSIDEKDPGFPAGEGFLKTVKGYGMGLFAAASTSPPISRRTPTSRAAS